MDYVELFNAIEAAWWIGLGAVLLVRPLRNDSRRHRRMLAACLIVFGASDVIEIWSGAWWRPWWLAALKIGCGFLIASLVLLWYRQASGER